MKIHALWVQKRILAGVYIYLALPVVLFFFGWCRWQIGIPLAVAVVCAVALCLREHCKNGSPFLHPDPLAVYTVGSRQWAKICLMIAAVLMWTWLSGVGGYVWQNSDHPIRNEIFRLLMDEAWPVVKETQAGARGLVYYLGYWLPAAAVGKLCGPKAGWAAQYVWAVWGILLLYALYCSWRRKLSVWPLVLMIWFSGPDVLGLLLRNPRQFEIFGTLCLDEWFGYYQFSSMTTQLFWVFNQAVPAWVLCMLVFLGEKPENLVFAASLAVLTSTFPFAGLVPFIAYFMLTRTAKKPFPQNSISPQNLMGVVIAGVSFLYISGNGAVEGSIFSMLSGKGVFAVGLCAAGCAGCAAAAARLSASGKGAVWKTAVVLLGMAAVAARVYQISGTMHPLRYFLYLVIFYILEAGLFLAALYPFVKDRKLFVLTGVWLFVIPLILVGNSSDFCMRASIPGLFLLMLWCIQALEQLRNTKIKTIRTIKTKRKKLLLGLLSALLLLGALTPLHEMTRAVVNTRSGGKNETAPLESVLEGNNFSGAPEGLFWDYLAKKKQ